MFKKFALFFLRNQKFSCYRKLFLSINVENAYLYMKIKFFIRKIEFVCNIANFFYTGQSGP